MDENDIVSFLFFYIRILNHQSSHNTRWKFTTLPCLVTFWVQLAGNFCKIDVPIFHLKVFNEYSSHLPILIFKSVFNNGFNTFFPCYISEVLRWAKYPFFKVRLIFFLYGLKSTHAPIVQHFQKYQESLCWIQVNLYQHGNTLDGKPPVVLQEVRWKDQKEDS